MENQNYPNVLPIRKHIVYDLWVDKLGKNVTLINFCDRYVSSEHVLAWGQEQVLQPVAPRICFEVADYVPELNYDLGMPFMALIALAPATKKAYGVKWTLAEKKVFFPTFYGVFSSEAWFALERKPTR
ncbi:MAG: hypothetical protein HY007_02725 [Candidatus Sungbacteria bacterium]|nr:hypothetical protein [Candidatus Sungbacteria bacterium]